MGVGVCAPRAFALRDVGARPRIIGCEGLRVRRQRTHTEVQSSRGSDETEIIGVLDEEQQLIAKLRKIEALFNRPGTEGERRAAESASARIRARLATLEGIEPAIEVRFSLADTWSRALFVALLRRHGLTPYRYSGQRRTTVMVTVARTYVDTTLWPEFTQFQ